ncbi:fumarylacetoacetate hydrolase family protein [Agrococcus baldri]|uniref:2-hydroxyhepta-2,4-diene-1,7-dioate isomerase n=1 Tax=Agrococcus baldri TaxID=153730 RepID=A0AA87USW0_9MICO|nr:fumarylacetoacetate hydrolase family protein [Agrococcus baldri]GEK81044.1 2-hydroxyhepta-2,4-diene-1,7-dioate isomerase [Agrococcus baldri]
MRIARVALDGSARSIVHARPVGAIGADGLPEAWMPIDDPYRCLAEGREPRDASNAPVAASSATLLPPAAPALVIGIAQNRGANDHPLPVQAWLKSPRGVVAHGEPVTTRRDAGRLVVEAEIAVVIGRDSGDPTAPQLTEANAHEFVLGVTAVNDISYPDRAQLDARNFESKGGDGSTPLGPWIDTEASIDELELALELDGRRVCDTSAQAMPVPVREALAYVARWVRLGPGDVIMAGAPHSNHEAAPGQRAAVIVGELRLETPLR